MQSVWKKFLEGEHQDYELIKLATRMAFISAARQTTHQLQVKYLPSIAICLLIYTPGGIRESAFLTEY